jgi:1-hydroxycarotenoid 3,4-desaturase
MADQRVAIIGAGVGGLVSAALLAARGLDVTVFEAAATPGGKLREIEVDGSQIDGGPTVFTLREVFDEIFEECGTSLDEALTIRPAMTLARHSWGEARLDLFADAVRSEDAIGDFAGAAAVRGYRAFRAESKRIHDALDRPFMRRSQTNPLGLGLRMGLGGLLDYATLRPYTSLWTALGEYFPDRRLRQMFARYATYCGSSPFAAPATLMLIAHVEASGVGLIEGGMYRLAEALEALARGNGARFRYGTSVSEIVVESGRAVGVVLTDGERLVADRVICNADPAALADGCFGVGASRAVSKVPPGRRSLSAMVWTAAKVATEFPLTRHNVFFSDDYPAEFAALAAGRLATSPSVYVCAQDRGDDGAAPQGLERVQIIVNAPAIGDTTPFDPAELATCQRQMQQTLERAGCSLALADSSTRLTTPGDFASLFPSTGGALYGPASHRWAASFQRQGSRTRIAGLYCAGGSTHPGAGVPMAALSARLAVACLLRDHASTSRSGRAAMPGGISMRPAPTASTA